MKKDKNIIFITMFLILTAFLNVVSFAANDSPALTVDAKSAVLIESSTGRVLFEKNPNERLAPASVTKVMTILLVYEAVEEEKVGWDDIVTVSEHASGMGGSQVYLEPMERQTVRDLVKCIVIASANDAAVAMAEFVAGSEESFVDLMNKKAEELGMKDTHFVNACGLDDDNHYSSAYDIALMSRELINRYPQALEYATVWQDTIMHKTARGDEEFGLTNTNKLIKWYNGSTGLKTGSTGKALFCLSASAKRDDMHLISVIMAAPTPSVRFQESMKMLDYGFANFKLAKGGDAGQKVGEIKVYKGKADLADVAVKSQVAAVLPKGNTEELQPELSINEFVSAPVQAGQVVGEITYYHNGTVVGKSPLVTVLDVEKASLTDMLRKTTALWFE